MSVIRRTVLGLLSGMIFLFSLAAPAVVHAETIAVIGTGAVGSALGPRFASLGHEIVYGSRAPERDDVQALVAEGGAGLFRRVGVENAGEPERTSSQYSALLPLRFRTIRRKSPRSITVFTSVRADPLV